MTVENLTRECSNKGCKARIPVNVRPQLCYCCLKAEALLESQQ